MTIGAYETVRLLGKGGMSEVYEVENVRLGSHHAMKLFTYEKDDPDVRARFMVEGKLLARLNHPRIVKVTDFGEDPASGRPYFVMELVLDARGQVRSLADIPPGTVDETEIGRWYDDLREGLDYIHGNGVVHRDLKLQNVLVGPDGHVVLTDFGISKVFDTKGEGLKLVDTINTIIKMKEGRSLVMGSLGYMAPELEMGVAASPQSDWYALGVIVYRLLTGTWCDSRTDVVGALDTYDSAWRRILPKLLHSNPNGRECLCFADETRSDRERAELDAEDRWLAEKSRGRTARHVARWMTAVVVVLVGALAVGTVKYRIERKLWRAEGALVSAQRSPFAFDELFGIPAGATSEEKRDSKENLVMPSREMFGATRVDMMIVTHDVLSKLNSGGMTIEKAIEELERLQERFSEDVQVPFDAWPDGYMQLGDDETIVWMLGKAIDRLKEIADR